MLVQHIINDRLWWFDLWMGEASPEVASFMHWEEEEKGESVHSAEELVAGLEATWRMIEAALARWTVADLSYVFEPPDALTEAERETFGPSTRQEIMFHVLRHDIHHGGELAVGMGQYHRPTFGVLLGVYVAGPPASSSLLAPSGAVWRLRLASG
jgi:uncharacterized damage-inducible protein DinB